MTILSVQDTEICEWHIEEAMAMKNNTRQNINDPCMGNKGVGDLLCA